MNSKKWCIRCLVTLLSCLVIIAALVWIVDPYFHFHKPFSFIKYRLSNERYINDGISRHFDFDAMVTGTSMTQNFKPSEVDELFGTQCVKESFSGASYHEINDNLERALKRNDDLKLVIRSIEYNALIGKADYMTYSDYPTYLYDDNPWNDVNYIFNKDILYHGLLTNLQMTLLGAESTSMDAYSSWNKETGLVHILETYDRVEYKNNPREDTYITEEEKQMVVDTITKNFVEIANKYPDTTFYLFYTPYSICYWESSIFSNHMESLFEAEEIATSILLECPNIKLYNFFNQYDVITNVNNYRDKEHYSAEINSQILQWMKDDTGLLTKDNYLDRLEEEKAFYRSYDYESIYK